MTQYHLQPLARRILELQQDNGAINWVDSGIVDPWNHIEAAMGLAVAGERRAVDQAFYWLRCTQHNNGMWEGDLGAAAPIDWTSDKFIASEAPKAIDLNFIAYVAVGLWHHYLVFDDKGFVERHWDMVESAIDFVISYQRKDGSFPWTPGSSDPALVTGCCSIRLSINYALNIASVIGKSRARWHEAYSKLCSALETYFLVRRNLHRHRYGAVHHKVFDDSHEKKRHAMDWYYPVLTGCFDEETSRAHLYDRWQEFVVLGHGCRCVEDEPWVTAAETAELAIALVSCGHVSLAKSLMQWADGCCADKEDGLWMGYQLEQQRVWLRERPAWTSAAALLTYDSIYHITRGHNIFTRPTKNWIKDAEIRTSYQLA